MVEVKEILDKCSELILTMEELEKEVPIIREDFEKCEGRYDDVCNYIEEEEDAFAQRFEECQKKLDKQNRQITTAIKKYEKVYENIVGNEDLLEKIKNFEETQKEMQKKMLEYEKIFEKIRNYASSIRELQSKVSEYEKIYEMIENYERNQREINEKILEYDKKINEISECDKTINRMKNAKLYPNSLWDILWKEKYMLPLAVHKDGGNNNEGSWNINDYFVIEDTDDEYAYGVFYENNKKLGMENIRLEKAPFSVYEPYEEAPF